MKLQGKKHIPCFSYNPDQVQTMDQAGVEIGAQVKTMDDSEHK